MTPRLFRLCFLFVAVASCVHSEARAQDNVTISKSRLEELERKEAELNKLKGVESKTADENARLKKQHEADAAKLAATPVTPAPTPVVVRPSPPIDSLPAISRDETVDSLDLSQYYRQDPTSADQRFAKHSFKVRGEVVGFEKKLFARPYHVLLKTVDQSVKIDCEVNPPEGFTSVYPAKEGTELTATMPGGKRGVLMKVGDTVVVSGQCTGLRDLRVHMSSCELKSVAVPGKLQAPTQ
jgi:hypothetical protein